MTKKSIVLIALVVLLGGLSLYVNRDRFRSVPIQISTRPFPPRGRPAGRNPRFPANTVIFLLNRDLRLTSVRVVAVSETNQPPHTLWELVSDSRSAPVRDFIYGRNIRGMKPAVKGVAARG